jgi:flagellar basal-body rod protein FlgC
MNTSSVGMSIHKKKMDLVAENLANTETTRMNNNQPYMRKTLRVSEKDITNQLLLEGQNIKHLKTSNLQQYEGTKGFEDNAEGNTLHSYVVEDATPGDLVFMPSHPDADENGYVQMPNVNVVTEMVDMISATRGFEANLTAFNASKQIAKDSLEI